MNLEKMARKCRHMIAQRKHVAKAFARMRKEIFDLKAQVSELSKSHLLAEIHWMKAEIVAFRELQARIPALEASFAEREKSIKNAQFTVEKDVRDGVIKQTAGLRNQLESLHKQRQLERTKPQEEIDRLRKELEEERECNFEAEADLEPAWVLAFNPPPSASDPIYHLRLQ